MSRSFRAISIGSPVSTSFCGLQQDLILRRANLGLDDLDGQILLLAAETGLGKLGRASQPGIPL